MKKISNLFFIFFVLVFLSCENDFKEIEQNNPDDKTTKDQITSNSAIELDIKKQPLILNSSFEKKFYLWEINKGSYDVSIDSTKSVNGTNSIKFTANNTSSFYAVPRIKTPVFQNIQTNSIYQISFWMKGQISHPNVCSLYYFFKGGGNNTTISDIKDDWTEYKFELVTGSILYNLELVFQPTLAITTIENYNKPLGVNNTIWIDNLTIRKIN